VDELAMFVLAVYAPEGSTANLEAEAKQLIGARQPGVQIVAEAGIGSTPQSPEVWVFSPPMAEFAPPDPQQLRYFGRGLSEADAPAIAKSPSVVVMTWFVPSKQLTPILHSATALTRDLAASSGGWV